MDRIFIFQLPNGDIRKLILEESQICYADGTVSTYSGRNDCSFTLQTIEEDDIEAVRDEYNDQFEYMPIELDAAWVCGCGRCNGRDEAVCSNCGSEKEHVLQLSTPDYISELKVKHEAKEQERKEQAAAEEAQKAKARKKRIIKIGIICVAVAIYIVFRVALKFSAWQFFSMLISWIIRKNLSCPLTFTASPNELKPCAMNLIAVIVP